MKRQVCSKCKSDKPLSDFHRDNRRESGAARYCKACKKDYDKHGPDKKLRDKYVVYYLPKHNYIGMTYNLHRRIRAHKTVDKRDTAGYKIVIATRSKRIAHLVETFLHIIGFKGFRY